VGVPHNRISDDSSWNFGLVHAEKHNGLASVLAPDVPNGLFCEQMVTLCDARLYGILDLSYVDPVAAVATAGRMIEGGVQVLQLRAKGHAPSDIEDLAGRVATECRAAGVPFIVNDLPTLARAVGADGVHVGQDDLGLAEARTLAGGIVGKSTHSLAQAIAACGEGADYIGFGPLFATPTKPTYPPVGLAQIRAVHHAVNLPIFCIGGIHTHNLREVLDAGAVRVVLVSGILQSADIVKTCRELRKALGGRDGQA
jgi:thiamine-phosphate pyrophosphorylase